MFGQGAEATLASRGNTVLLLPTKNTGALGQAVRNLSLNTQTSVWNWKCQPAHLLHLYSTPPPPPPLASACRKWDAGEPFAAAFYSARWAACTYEMERGLSQRLLYNTLPARIADQLLDQLRGCSDNGDPTEFKRLTLAYSHSCSTILFAGCPPPPPRKGLSFIKRMFPYFCKHRTQGLSLGGGCPPTAVGLAANRRQSKANRPRPMANFLFIPAKVHVSSCHWRQASDGYPCV